MPSLGGAIGADQVVQSRPFTKITRLCFSLSEPQGFGVTGWKTGVLHPFKGHGAVSAFLSPQLGKVLGEHCADVGRRMSGRGRDQSTGLC